MSREPSADSYLWGAGQDQHTLQIRRGAETDLDFLLPYLMHGVRVLDLGCGPGSLTCDIAARVAPGTVLGIDIAEVAVEAARTLARERELNNVRFEIGDARSTGLPDESFDVVVISGVLTYLRAPEQALAEAYRLLAPGGVIGAREMAKQGDWYAGPHAEDRHVILRALIASVKSRGGDPYLGLRLKRLLLDAGFRDVDGYPSYSRSLASPRRLLRTADDMVNNPNLAEALAREGIVTEEDRAELIRRVKIWAAAPESVVAVAEMKAWGTKPRSS